MEYALRLDLPVALGESGKPSSGVGGDSDRDRRGLFSLNPHFQKVPQSDEMTQVIEALQRVRAANEIQRKFSYNDEFLTKKNELRVHLDERSKKLDALLNQMTGILGQDHKLFQERSAGKDQCAEGAVGRREGAW